MPLIEFKNHNHVVNIGTASVKQRLLVLGEFGDQYFARMDRAEFEQFCDDMIDGTDTVSRDWLFHFCTTLLARRAPATSAAALSEELKYEYRGFYVVEYNRPEVKGASITGTYNNTRLPERTHFASKEACMGYIDCHLDDTPAQGAAALRAASTDSDKGSAA